MLREAPEGCGKLQQRWRRQANEGLKFYQDICQIRRFIYKITGRFPKTHFRLVSQMRDAARSAKQNIREGYKRGSIGEYIHSIRMIFPPKSGHRVKQLFSSVQIDKGKRLLRMNEYVFDYRTSQCI